MEWAIKARKEYKCANCHKTIRKGEVYIFGKEREPRYTQDNMGNILQDGIKYLQWRVCLKKGCGETWR